jgi:hypothetical protein
MKDVVESIKDRRSVAMVVEITYLNKIELLLNHRVCVIIFIIIFIIICDRKLLKP